MNFNSLYCFKLYRRRVAIASVLAALFMLLPNQAFAEQTNVLFVASGYYQQETDIYNHLQDLGGFDITIKKDYRIKGSTNLTSYDLIIITGFAPNIRYSGLNKIKNSGIPVLIVEYWDFWYSYRLGLLRWDSGDYYGTDTVELINDQHPITNGLDQDIEVHDLSYAVLYGASINSLSQDTEPLIYSWPSANEAAVIVDDDRKIVATGIYDTTHYTDAAWDIFDRLIAWVMPVSVDHVWNESPTDNAIYVDAVTAPDGSTLAYTSYGAVHKIDETGATSELLSGSGDVSGPSVTLNSGGDTFLERDSDTLALYDYNGDPLGSFSVADAYYARQIPGTELILLPQIDHISGDGELPNGLYTGGRIVDSTGILQYEFTSDGLAPLEITSENIVYLTPDEIVVLSLQGVELRRMTQKVESLDTSDNAAKIIVEDGSDTTRVVHFDGAASIHEVSLGEAVWDVAISPDGIYSAATTKNAVHIFHEGELQISTPLPVAFTASLDVSNHGEVTVGAKNADGSTHLFLLNNYGMILWEEETGIVDRYGWRPDVAFQNDGEAISVRTRNGIDFFLIERGL